MGKKDKNIQNNQTMKIKQMKNNKSKNKQMFTQLKTHEENKISKFNHSKSSNFINPQQMVNQDEQNSYQGNLQLKDSKQNKNIQQLCTIVHNLLSKNKISAKNAFEVPFIDLQKMSQFQNISQFENGWRKISSTLQSDSKIYSYRVDAIHSIAYKIMNTMTRNRDQDPQAKLDQGQNKIKKQSQLENQAFPIVEDEQYKVSTHLQKNIENINLQQLVKASEYNPNYQRTRRRFDQNGLSGMLLNNIQIDKNLQLSLNQERKMKPIGFYSEAIPVEVNKLTQNLNIFRNIQNTRKNVYNIVRQQYVSSAGYELSWKQILNGQFNCEKVSDQNQMDIQIDDRVESTSFRRVEDAIKFKTKAKIVLKSSNDIVQDSLNWLSDVDRKMLGIRGPQTQNSIGTVKKNSSIRSQKNQDDIDFDAKRILQKKEIFSQQTMQKQKQQFNEQIEQKHLLPIRLFHKFKVQQIMTLRQEPPQNMIQNMEMGQYQNQLGYQIQQGQRQRQQIDIKRQQMSIRQSKQKLKLMMVKQTDFNSLCKKFQINENNIAPQLCFLTVLHLANQNNLKLEQINDYNFRIKS